MNLQVAIDRVDLKTATELARKLDGKVDIIEVGTSLIKDYGLIQLKPLVSSIHESKTLLDLKTADEGAYEFKKGSEAGANQLTVLANADDGTLEAVEAIARKAKRTLFIDLLSTTPERVASIAHYQDAIFGLHHAVDSTAQFDANATVARFHHDFPQIKRLAIAGGITLDAAKELKKQGLVETIIVGGKITGASDPLAAALNFMEVVHA